MKRWGMARRLLFGIALIFFAAPASAEESLLDVVLKRDKLIVATYSTSPPLAYVDDSGTGSETHQGCFKVEITL